MARPYLDNRLAFLNGDESDSPFVTFSYSENKTSFIKTGESVGASMASYLLKEYVGPNGEPLTIDVAKVGSADAKKVVVITSGIHGVELPIGTALQCLWLAAAEEYCSKDKDVRFVFVHALNPYGAAYGLRNDQENIDPNRNFVDFDHPPETSKNYRALASAFSPQSVHPLAIGYAWMKLFKFAGTQGIAKFKQALAGGQYAFPDGLYYGGTHSSWTRKTWETIVQEHVVSQELRNLWHIDLHSGDGLRGKMSIMVNADFGSDLYYRAKTMAGCCQKLRLSQPTFAKLSGDITEYWSHLGLPAACEVTPVTIEFGTTKSKRIEGLDVLHAMIMRNALHERHEDKHRHAEKIIQRMRDTFDPPDRDWQQKTINKGRYFMMTVTERALPK